MNYTIKTSTYYEALLALAVKFHKVVLKHDKVSKEDVEKALEIANNLKEENEIMHAAFIARENRRYGDTLSTAKRLEAKAISILKEISEETNEDFESMDKDQLVELVKKMREEKARKEKEEEEKVLVLRAPKESNKDEETDKA